MSTVLAGQTKDQYGCSPDEYGSFPKYYAFSGKKATLNDALNAPARCCSRRWHKESNSNVLNVLITVSLAIPALFGSSASWVMYKAAGEKIDTEEYKRKFGELRQLYPDPCWKQLKDIIDTCIFHKIELVNVEEIGWRQYSDKHHLNHFFCADSPFPYIANKIDKDETGTNKKKFAIFLQNHDHLKDLFITQEKVKEVVNDSPESKNKYYPHCYFIPLYGGFSLPVKTKKYGNYLRNTLGE